MSSRPPRPQKKPVRLSSNQSPASDVPSAFPSPPHVEFESKRTAPSENRVSNNPHLRERELAERWQTSQRTLQRWRAEGFGPAYILIGGAIRYRFADVLDYESRMRRGGEAS